MPRPTRPGDPALLMSSESEASRLTSSSPTTSLSASEARRLAIASQAFGPRPATVTLSHVRKLATRLNAFQIDSVNVLVRAHYMPAFARLGPYPMDALDTLTYRNRELFEY